jgi:hypothetical protein
MMARMTEDEADALDEAVSNADLTLKPSADGVFTRLRALSRQREPLDSLESANADYIMTSTNNEP